MLTCARAGIVKPNTNYANVVEATSISLVPSLVRSALHDPNWLAAMQAEFDALKDNSTWQLVPRLHGANVVFSKWVFHHKFKLDGSLDRYKAQWVICSFHQRPGVDLGQTFSPVVKPVTTRPVLHIWHPAQLDASNDFLHGVLSE